MVNVLVPELLSVQEAAKFAPDWENAKLVAATGTTYATVGEFVDDTSLVPG